MRYFKISVYTFGLAGAVALGCYLVELFWIAARLV